jgi:hypothetical protein
VPAVSASDASSTGSHLAVAPEGAWVTYFVRADETGATCVFGYADIVTEGFRTIRAGERVRFLPDPPNSGHAMYVIRPDLPDVATYYE